VELLEKVWLEKPQLVLICVGEPQLNAYSALRRVKEITPEVKVAFYSECSEYALEAYDKGADYFLPYPADDIQIGKLVFRFLGAGQQLKSEK
jgi:DNA-binding NarL/FixJ family response regulator